jgi:IMP dehydrogenase
MKRFIATPAYSLSDFRILPGHTTQQSSVGNVSLRTRLCSKGDDFIYIELPFVSAAMQAVTSVELATALAELGGVGVLPVSEPIETQCGKLRQIKQYKAGFQTDILTYSPSERLAVVKSTIDDTGYSIFPVTDNGLFHGKLLGVITDKDFDPRFDLELAVADRMKEDVQVGVDVDDLKEANHLMIQFGHGFLPIVSREGTLQSVVFKRDLDKHIQHPHASVDCEKRLCVGGAVSTHPEDRERARALDENDVDFFVIDSSDGFSVYQEEMLWWLKKNVDAPAIGGNVVTVEGFEMLADAGADGVKVGMGIGSGCITQEVKATGRGQATALLEIVSARDAYAEKGRYIPIIADGGVSTPAGIAIALAMGADTVMMGNYFARMSESPGSIHHIDGQPMKAYWMEGSLRAKNLRRYDHRPGTYFEEGIDGYVPYAGSIYDVLPVAAQRLKATLSTAGAATMDDFHRQAILELQSAAALGDSSVHNMVRATG